MLKAGLLLGLIAFPAQVATTPDTPTLQVFQQWLAAFNTGDAAKLTAFWQKYSHNPTEPRVSGDLQLRDMTGGLKLFRVVQDNGKQLVALMREGRGGYSESTIDWASSNPPIIQFISGHPVPPPGEPEPVAANDQNLAARIQSHVAHMPATDSYSGAILVAHDGKLVLDQAWGMADREKKIKNTVDTQFCLGSMNKMFTAVSILQLLQEGRITLDDSLIKYWPDYPNKDLASRVTIRQLLTHTGGTGDIFTPEYDAHRLDTRSLADYITLFGSRPLSFEPGSRMEYSNYGFILLGRLIEIVSGESYEEYVQKHIYAPAGMMHTDSRPEGDHLSGRAVGYHSGPAGLHSNATLMPWGGTSAGGGYSTIGDLLLFAKALESGKLIDTKLLQQATTDQTHRGYGFGFYASADGTYGHGGGGPGINGEMRILPKKGYVIVVLANRDPSMASSMETYIESILPAIRGTRT